MRLPPLRVVFLVSLNIQQATLSSGLYKATAFASVHQHLHSCRLRQHHGVRHTTARPFSISSPTVLQATVGQNKMAAERVAAELQERFRSGETRSYAWRMKQIRGVIRMMTECETELISAVCTDTGKPVEEMRISEITQTLCAASFIEKNLEGWMADEYLGTWGILFPSTPTIRHEPYGTVLLMAPFNFPLMLVVKPLLGAVAAGNCVLVKPSELCPATSALMAKLFPMYLDPLAVRVLEGGVAVSQALISQRWDFICFTGSKRVGKIVAKAAAEHLTPCLLELGGKNVAIVDEQVHSLDVVARRLLWGRFLNAGQSCIAPDVVVVVTSRQAEALKKKMLECYKVFYGTDAKKSPDFGRLISKDAALRVQTLLQGGDIGQVLIGGDCDPDDRYVAPTILCDTPATSKLMADEVFGPVVSVVTAESIDSAIGYVDTITRDPLALYIFSSRTHVVQRIISAIPSGGVVVNDCMVQQGQPHVPFGGRGESGLGMYHGRFSFDTFSQKRSILYKHFNRNHPLVDFWIRYPPGDRTKAFLLNWLARKLPLLPGRVSGLMKLLLVAAPLLYAVGKYYFRCI